MALNRYLILVADHGLNASTFAARSVISTATDVGSAVVAAVGSLSGPLHGGAPSRVLEMFNDIGDISNAQAWAREKIDSGAKIMGFGHRVYKTYDPRARVLKATAHEINAPLADYAEAVEETIIQTFDELKPGRSISTNVEYWSAVVMDAVGLPPELFTPTFVVSRMVGWTAHINEQLANNRIFRPRASYIGPALRSLSEAD
jgi:citrate synthase